MGNVYIKFELLPRRSGWKTDLWHVNSGDACLGEVRWYGAWRQYCFMPNPNTIFDRSCLREIAEFCVKETIRHKDTAAGPGPGYA